MIGSSWLRCPILVQSTLVRGQGMRYASKWYTLKDVSHSQYGDSLSKIKDNLQVVIKNWGNESEKTGGHRQLSKSKGSP